MSKLIFTGSFEDLRKKGYEYKLEDVGTKRYYFKTIKSKVTNKELTIFVDKYDKEISFVGDMNYKYVLLGEIDYEIKD